MRRGGAEDAGSGRLQGENHATIMQAEVEAAHLYDGDDVRHRLHGQGGVTTGKVEDITKKLTTRRKKRGEGEKRDEHEDQT